MRAWIENSEFCPYCEQKMGENGEDDHYRPKSIYTWLKDEPENILKICRKCNNHKDDNFAINKPIYEGTRKDLSSSELDKLEEPLLVNPKKQQQSFFTDHLVFHSEDATIHSENLRLHYTIGCCKLNRKYLIEKRLEALNDAKNKIQILLFLHHKDENQKKEKLQEYCAQIRKMVKNNSIEFSAMFRFFILKPTVYQDFVKRIENNPLKSGRTT